MACKYFWVKLMTVLLGLVLSLYDENEDVQLLHTLYG